MLFLSNILTVLVGHALAKHEGHEKLHERGTEAMVEEQYDRQADKHVDQADGVLEARQGSFGAATSASVVQLFSTIYTYSFWTYSPVTSADTTTFDSSVVTTSTVITVSARDQFHALQALLTAGQSVQDSASSSAAQAAMAITAPASVSATPTSTSSTTSSASQSSASMAAGTSSRQGGSACSTVPRICRGIALAGAFAWANL